MTSKRIAQTNQQQKSEKPRTSGILQRAAVRSVSDAGVQSTDDQEVQPLSDSAFSKDFSRVPISTTKPQQIMAKQMVSPVVQSVNAPVSARLSESETVQREEMSEASRVQKENKTGLPDNLKFGIENLSGISMDSVKVQYNSPKPAQLQALAYTQGTDIHVAPGQEKHLAHEAWHVVQQKQGRVKPTMQAKGVAINDDQDLEREADVMGTKALQMKRTLMGEPELTHVVQQNTIQAKLTIGQPGDKYEQEADKVAKQVVQQNRSAGKQKENNREALKIKKEPRSFGDSKFAHEKKEVLTQVGNRMKAPKIVPSGNSMVVQRMGDVGDDSKGHINKKKQQRKFGEEFENKHIRSSDTNMIEAAEAMMRQRSQGKAIPANTIISMTSYQKELFMEQEHTFLENNRYRSTTKFPAAEVTQVGEIRLYSQAKFEYSGINDEDGLFQITHFYRLADAELEKQIKPGERAKKTTFDD